MVFTDVQFNTSGKIPTNANFWKQSVDQFVTSTGFTSKFSKVIAEQYFLSLQSPKTPWYNNFTGRPLNTGAGFTERIMEQKVGDHFNPKATASDALSFYDNTGIEKTFEIDVQGWRHDSLPSDLMTMEEFVDGGDISRLNDMIYQIQAIGYQMDMDSMIAKKAVSCSTGKVEVDGITDMTKLYEAIRDTATDMMCRGVTGFNELTEDENANIDISAERVLAFMPIKLWNQLRSSRASLPSPDELIDNVTVIPVYDTALPTPLTTAQWGVKPSTNVTWVDKPANIDGATPVVFLADPRKFEYRPVRGTYKVNLNMNGAGDFTNAHMVYRGCCAVKPWYNACSIVPKTGA